MAVLQQQVGELRVDTETSSVEHLPNTGDGEPSSGAHAFLFQMKLNKNKFIEILMWIWSIMSEPAMTPTGHKFLDYLRRPCF